VHVTIRHRLTLLVGLIGLTLGALPAHASPADNYLHPHFGAGKIPAGCIVGSNPANPDNHCYHMKVGLNALDSPKVDVDVLVPVSPTAERDLRMMTQSVQMWAGGIKYLSGQMNLPWLRDGVQFRIHSLAVAVDEAGQPLEAVKLVDPEIVVVATNPTGGIGIGVDPIDFGNQLIEIMGADGQEAPCSPIGNPFSMSAWQARDGFEQHGSEDGGVYVEDCGGAGGNVCFSVNGAVDPVPGASDFFPIYDLVSHETGHCLTLGHVGDGADGPWGPTPTNDIMAYSTDPPGAAKCVSTLDVEGFALRMSNYLDVNGDGKVTAADKLVANDPHDGYGASYQIQNPADHWYASPTGDPADCPQPDYSVVANPLEPGTDWTPTPVKTTRPALNLGKVGVTAGRLTVAGVAKRVSLLPPVTATSGSVTDASADAISPTGDITGWKVKVSATAVDAEMKVSQLWPGEIGSAEQAYSILISGRRLDSFVPNGSTDGTPVVMDNGTGYYLPPGTATWDADTNTVKFHVLREYLAENNIKTPYAVTGVTGFHERGNDWVADDDHAPDKGGIRVTGPAMQRVTFDKPRATSVTTTTVNVGSGSFTPAQKEILLVSNPAGYQATLPVPIAKQSTVSATLTWDDPSAALGLALDNGSAQRVVKRTDTSVTVEVPWARRDLLAVITAPDALAFPPAGEVAYHVTAKITTVIKDDDADGVPDVADVCVTAPGPYAGGGCPDADGDQVLDRFDACRTVAGIGADGCPTARGEKIVVTVDNVVVGREWIVTQHGSDAFQLSAPVHGRRHTVKITWYAAGKVVASRIRYLR